MICSPGRIPPFTVSTTPTRAGWARGLLGGPGLSHGCDLIVHAPRHHEFLRVVVVVNLCVSASKKGRDLWVANAVVRQQSSAELRHWLFFLTRTRKKCRDATEPERPKKRSVSCLKKSGCDTNGRESCDASPVDALLPQARDERAARIGAETPRVRAGVLSMRCRAHGQHEGGRAHR